MQTAAYPLVTLPLEACFPSLPSLPSLPFPSLPLPSPPSPHLFLLALLACLLCFALKLFEALWRTLKLFEALWSSLKLLEALGSSLKLFEAIWRACFYEESHNCNKKVVNWHQKVVKNAILSFPCEEAFSMRNGQKHLKIITKKSSKKLLFGDLLDRCSSDRQKLRQNRTFYFLQKEPITSYFHCKQVLQKCVFYTFWDGPNGEKQHLGPVAKMTKKVWYLLLLCIPDEL